MPDQGNDADAEETDAQAGTGGPDGTVNSQVMDAVTALNALAAGGAPSSAAAMLGLVAANTIGLGMHNAIARQQADAAIASASVAAACARKLGASVNSDGQPLASSALIAAAEAQAQSANALLRTQARGDAAANAEATAALARIAQAAAPTPSPAPPPSPAKPAKPRPKAGKAQ